jgi:RNA polymerase subunit RPABC4/transcription elongation factor Spt4
MTVEKACFILPSDIKAIRITCTKCGTATLVPLSYALELGAVLERNCVVCGSSTGFKRDTTEWSGMVLLVEKLGKLSETMKSREISCSFQIECPTG